MRIDKRVEAFLYLSVYHFDGADFDYFILQNLESGRFEVENNHRVVQKKLRRSLRRPEQIHLIRLYVRLRLHHHIFCAGRLRNKGACVLVGDFAAAQLIYGNLLAFSKAAYRRFSSYNNLVAVVNRQKLFEIVFVLSKIHAGNFSRKILQIELAKHEILFARAIRSRIVYLSAHNGDFLSRSDVEYIFGRRVYCPAYKLLYAFQLDFARRQRKLRAYIQIALLIQLFYSFVEINLRGLYVTLEQNFIVRVSRNKIRKLFGKAR